MIRGGSASAHAARGLFASCRWIVPLALAIVLVARGGTAQDVERRQVARLEVAVPAHSPFLLHACVPVPKGVVATDGTHAPLFVASHARGNPLVPSQVEIVSRYPTGEADVVEVLASVEADPSEHAGSQAAFSLLIAPNEKASAAHEPAVTARVRDLLARDRRGRFGLRTRDVYGNTYWADLSGNADDPGFGSVRLLASGAFERVRRVYATLAPTPSDKRLGEPLPHMMGVHVYVTERASDDCVSLDLRVNNGAVAGSREATPLESTLGIVYWRSLELVIPKGWNLVPQARDPFFGDAYDEADVRVVPIVKAYDDGKLQMMGPQAQLERRFVLAPDGQEAHARELLDNAGLAFCARGEGLWSWCNPTTARYFPQRDILASVDFFKRHGHGGKAAVRVEEAAEMNEYKRALETGEPHGYYSLSPVMGWAQPWFVKEQGSPGGEGIATFEGYYAACGAAREGVTKLELLHRMNVSRQPEAAYDRFGDPVGYHAWLDKDGKIPFDFRTNGGIFMPPFLLPCKRGPPASAQVRVVVEHDLRPPYDQGQPYLPEEKGGGVLDRNENLLAWWPHDDQHMVRYTKNTKALVWLANDALAKDDLVLSAELYHLMRHESPHVEASWSHGVTLAVWEAVVKAHPHQGVILGREDAWGIDSMCAAYSVASQGWRARNRAWFDRMSQLMIDASLSNGLIQRFNNVRLLGHEKYAVTQTFECLFLMHAIRCMNESVFRGVDDKRREALGEIVVRGIVYLFWGPPWARLPNGWQPDPAHPTIFLNGPRQGIAIAPNDDYASPPFCDEARWGPSYLPPDGLGQGVEIFHPWAALSYAQEITNDSAGSGLDNRFLRRALDCWTGHKDWRELAKDLEEQTANSSFDNSANWIGFLGKLQSLGVR